MKAPSGLYAITPQIPDLGTLCRLVEQALEGGAAAVQYRDKSHDATRRREQAAALAALCRSHGALFIVNDDVDLAAAVDADGVHLGRDDAAIVTARRVLGSQRIIGVSCYDSLELALQARAGGADYLAFGSFFASPTKPAAVRAPLSLLRVARREVGLPLVAIGGITAQNAPAVIAAGADAVAVISALFDAADVRAAARRLSGLFSTAAQPPGAALR